VPDAQGSRKNSQLTKLPPPAAGTVKMRSRRGSAAATTKESWAPGSDGMMSPGAIC
jgi:hypothetical protein